MKTYELTEEQKSALSEGDRKKYEQAISLCYCENAGGPGGGWYDGHRALISMGWKEVRQEQGHRVFVTLKSPFQLNEQPQSPVRARPA